MFKIPIKLKEKEKTPLKPLIEKGGLWESIAPQGLYYVPNFLTKEESEQISIELSSNQKWVGVTSSQKSRRVIHYGYLYSYTGGPLQETDLIPQIYHPIITRFRDFIGGLPPIALLSSEKNGSQGGAMGVSPTPPTFDQLIINEYLPGQGIGAHIDHTSRFGAIVACLTIGSGVEIEFTRTGHDSVKVYVEPNSLYIMSGDSRYLWKHSIIQRKSDTVNGKIHHRGIRVSLTFREALG